MYSSTRASVPMLSWMKRTRSTSFSSSSTTDAWEMPIEASRVKRLHDQGEAQAPRPPHRALAGDDHEVGARGCGDRTGSSWRAPCRGTAGAPASCSRCSQPQQLEVGDHVLVPGRDLGESLEQVEGDVGLELGDGAADHPELAAHPERAHLVPLLAQGVDDVELGLPLDVHHVLPLVVLGRDEALVAQGEDAELLHRASRWRPLWR